MLDDVDRYWTEYFSEQGIHYPPAARHWYQTRIPTPCSVAIPGVVGPFYCTRDSGLYLDTKFIQQVRQAAGDFPVAYVVAHEVGHHVQDLFGITKVNAYILIGQSFSLAIELQADCLAGVWSKSAAGRGLAAPEDVTRAIVVHGRSAMQWAPLRVTPTRMAALINGRRLSSTVTTAANR